MLALVATFTLCLALLVQLLPNRTTPYQPTVPGPPPYTGPADAGTASGLVTSGGGSQNFQIESALSGIVGGAQANVEWQKMHNRYRGTQEAEWAQVWRFVIRDATQRARRQHVRITQNSQLNGYALGRRLIRDGMDRDGTFETSLMLDHLFTHRVTVAVFRDVDGRFTRALTSEFQKVTNQVMYDVSFMVGMHGVKLSSLH